MSEYLYKLAKISYRLPQAVVTPSNRIRVPIGPLGPRIRPHKARSGRGGPQRVLVC
nr:unnamed protein product [Callosobruchus chinensis]